MSRWPSDASGIVSLPDGRLIRGRGLRTARPGSDLSPDFGVYLLGKEHVAAGWESRWIRWPDFRLPTAPEQALKALREAFDRAADERVEIACAGGFGRTGTAIAVLARLGGVPADEAVDWTRTHYRPRAIETPWQRRWASTVPLS